MKTVQSVLYVIFVSTLAFKMDEILKWGYVEIFWPFWMYLLLLYALSIIVLIFTVLSCKSFCLRKLPFKFALLGVVSFALMISYVSVFTMLGTCVSDALETGKDRSAVKKQLYIMCLWYMGTFLFLKFGHKTLMMFLYKTIFAEEGAEDLEEYDFDEEDAEQKNCKKKVDVKNVPNFMQRFTSTYFKFNPEQIKVEFQFLKRARGLERIGDRQNGIWTLNSFIFVGFTNPQNNSLFCVILIHSI